MVQCKKCSHTMEGRGPVLCPKCGCVMVNVAEKPARRYKPKDDEYIQEDIE